MVSPRQRFTAELEAALPECDGPLQHALAGYLALVEQYAPALNLTAFRGPRQLAFELAVESLRLLKLGYIEPGWEVVDLGSGVGSPVVPLALACPRARFTAVESRQRRATFLRQVKAVLNIENLTIAEQRTEELIEERAGSFWLVTARAYAQPPLLLSHAAALLEQGGELRGYSGAEAEPLRAAAAAAGFAAEQQLSYRADDALRHIYRLRLSS